MNNNLFDYPFFRYPKAFIESPLFAQISIEARTLLAMILDRHCLSEINSERFTDENGRVYVIYIIDEACKNLGCGRTKAARIFHELENEDLIYRRRTNGSRPSKIYLTNRFLNSLKQDFAKSQNQTLQNHKTELCKVSKSASSKTDNNNTDIINTHSSITGFGMTEEEIKEQIEYDCIVCDDNRDLLEEIVMVIFDVINGLSPTVRIGKDEMPRSAVISRFRKLSSEHICYIISKLNRNETEIRNIKPYLIAMLYNAPSTMEAETTAEFAYRRKTTQINL